MSERYYIAYRLPDEPWAFDGPYAVRSNAEARNARFARDGRETRLCTEQEKAALQAEHGAAPPTLPSEILENLRQAEDAQAHTKRVALPRSPGRPRKIRKR